MDSINLGIANVKVSLLSEAPNLAKAIKKYNFEISAYDRQSIENSPFIRPLLAEYIEDPIGTFAAYYPSKRKKYVSNILNSEDGETPAAGFITWKPLIEPPLGLPKDIVESQDFYEYDGIPPPLSLETSVPGDYKGPFFENNSVTMPPNPNDAASIAGYIDWISSTGGEDTTNDEEITPISTQPWDLICSVYQKKSFSGLWWTIESSEFLEEDNTPFWVNFRKMDSPFSSTHETCFIIRLGPEESEQKFDIYIGLDKRPRIIDYLTAYDNEVPENQSEWATDQSRIVSQAVKDNDIEVGIMTIAGRLVVIINNTPLVYSRISRDKGDDGGQLLECKIAKGKIQIFGTNAQTRIIACPMSFAPVSVLALPLPSIISEGGGIEPGTIVYRGVNYKGEPEGSVAQITTPPSYSQPLFGVDCESFFGDGGSCSPYGFGFHRKGRIEFKKASKNIFKILPSTDFYTLTMMPSSTTTVAGIPVAYGGCPYFFRLKGLYEVKVTTLPTSEDISEYLISAEETAQADDYFHVKKNTSVTFYNEDNKIGDMVLKDQTSISLEWGWGEDTKKTFTGIVTSISKSEIAGKETITLNCEDYMYVLNHVPIINSPFYDGMVAVYAIKDLAERGGMIDPVKDWAEEEDYFLPAGYSFSQPAMRFSSSQMLFDCIIDIVKRFEAYVFFDGDGKFHINKLPGGLLSVPPSNPTVAFTSDPILGGINKTILEERSVDISFESTVNCISVLTLDRNTRNAIIYAKTATGKEDKLVFLKPFLYNQAAFGELEAAKAWVEEISQRMFFPILKTRFKTAGVTTANPLDFVTVDGHNFRITAIKRSFNADNNDLNSSYECEWLGGV